MSSVVIRSLDFTNSVGNGSTDDETFSDVLTIGGFPFQQNISRITKIKVYSDTSDPDSAVIVGLKVQYKLLDGNTTPVVSHGIVNVTKVGDFTIGENQLLVAVHGQLKSYEDNANDGRVATISFVLFDKKTAEWEQKGPYQGSSVNLGSVWAHFGHVIAFQGTKADGVGLTSLGFVQSIQPKDDDSPF